MRVVIACDSFKGSLDAMAAAKAMRDGAAQALPGAEIQLCPIADGGEGTARILTEAAGGHLHHATVRGPLMAPVSAAWGLLADGTAVLEMAQAAGLGLVPEEERDPTRTTTYGLGQLMLHALQQGAEALLIGIGGSATTDGGTGMAEALGARFAGCGSPMTGGELLKITSVDLTGLDERVRQAHIQVLLDVTNPLCGEAGAAAVFSPQKGATPEQVALLDRGLAHLASLVPNAPADIPGGGAAGGLGWGLVAFAGAELRSGIDLCLDTLGFDGLVAGADLVITGEGAFDAQTLGGKGPMGVARRAKACGVPTLVLCGNASDPLPALAEHGIVGCHAVTRTFHLSVPQAVAGAARHLTALAAEVIGGYLGRGPTA